MTWPIPFFLDFRFTFFSDKHEHFQNTTRNLKPQIQVLWNSTFFCGKKFCHDLTTLQWPLRNEIRQRASSVLGGKIQSRCTTGSTSWSRSTLGVRLKPRLRIASWWGSLLEFGKVIDHPVHFGTARRRFSLSSGSKLLVPLCLPLFGPGAIQYDPKVVLALSTDDDKHEYSRNELIRTPVFPLTGPYFLAFRFYNFKNLNLKISISLQASKPKIVDFYNFVVEKKVCPWLSRSFTHWCSLLDARFLERAHSLNECFLALQLQKIIQREGLVSSYYVFFWKQIGLELVESAGAWPISAKHYCLNYFLKQILVVDFF